ncbi:MAG: efflux RND transporter periplasmic adaptor subunit [Lachnospiraceae bacterium]|nr:efflux RND transporter periplasmic adaptor subunit [Lachnospiraceae bacterium]MBR5994129.1 efflux RND transporter periplasmic adaptor subunit [Lachnospiraceae bacterium]
MKNRLKTLVKKLSKKQIVAVSLAAVLIIGAIVYASVSLADGKDTVTYRETTVARGNLTVGVSESGSVDIGTITQTFDLDMSALSKVSTSNSESSSGGSGGSGFGGAMGGGMDMGGGASFGGGGSTGAFNQIFNMASGDNKTKNESNSKLVVAEICVSVGQTVSEGDVLYRLEEDGVSELTEELKSNVEKAEADLAALEADQEISKVSAQYNYDSAIAYKDFASTEKSSTIKSLEDSLETYKSGLKSAQKLVTLYKGRLAQAKSDLKVAEDAYNGAVWCRDNRDKRNDTAMYVYYAKEVESAKSVVSTLEQSVSQYESKLEQAENSVTNYNTQISKATRQLELGKISAEETYELRVLAYENAQETYDIALAYLEDDLKEQQEIYDEASQKWNEFVSYIDGTEVKSDYNGVITSVDLEEGDSLTTGATVVTLYDIDDVSMTVTIDEDNMTDIKVGSEANVSLIAYPDVIFTAVVSEISDATTDSSGNTTQDVTIVFTADVSGVYHGMTGEITFLTKDIEDVLYVSNRAIIRKGTKSYVKVKDNDGNIKTVEVVTGFSDGVNVEIKEGLFEGDTVLVESKVSK